MLKRFPVVLLLLALFALPASAQKPGLDIYFIDTEGGQATLMVTPAGESILIDSGNPGDRDAKRIFEVASKVANLKQIDNLIVTHWHLDHYGGHGALAKLIPCIKFYDHGIPEKSIDDPDNFPKLIAAYKEASKGKSTTLKPGPDCSSTSGLPAPPGSATGEAAALTGHRHVPRPPRGRLRRPRRPRAGRRSWTTR